MLLFLHFKSRHTFPHRLRFGVLVQFPLRLIKMYMHSSQMSLQYQFLMMIFESVCLNNEHYFLALHTWSRYLFKISVYDYLSFPNSHECTLTFRINRGIISLILTPNFTAQLIMSRCTGLMSLYSFVRHYAFSKIPLVHVASYQPFKSHNIDWTFNASTWTLALTDLSTITSSPLTICTAVYLSGIQRCPSAVKVDLS